MTADMRCHLTVGHRRVLYPRGALYEDAVTCSAVAGRTVVFVQLSARLQVRMPVVVTLTAGGRQQQIHDSSHDRSQRNTC